MSLGFAVWGSHPSEKSMGALAIYRSDYRPLLCRTGPVGLVLAASIMERLRGLPAWRELPLFLLLSLGLGAAFAGAICILVYVCPVTIYSHGLRSYNIWGRYSVVAWTQIRSVRPFQILGFRYLYLDVAELSQPLTVPLWLRDMEGFRRHVEQLAGPRHPLSMALQAAGV